MPKKALITGVTGQDGSYLAELLLEKGYEVFGVIRPGSPDTYERINHLVDKITVLTGDLLDPFSLTTLMETAEPDEVYNLAAISFVPMSWDQPVLTSEFTAIGVTKMLEAIRRVNPKIRFYQASSSEVFGRATQTPQNENTPFNPRTPYGVSKLYGHFITINYRERYDMFATSGILYNHESPRRGIEFLPRKVTDGVAKIVTGKTDELVLGNLDAYRDWGYAGDYVRAMWLMLQQDQPDDFVIASGISRQVKDLVMTAFQSVNLNYEDYVRIDPRFVRPPETNLLIGDPTKARTQLAWIPETTFEQMIAMMVQADIHRQNQPPPGE